MKAMKTTLMQSMKGMKATKGMKAMKAKKPAVALMTAMKATKAAKAKKTPVMAMKARKADQEATADEQEWSQTWPRVWVDEKGLPDSRIGATWLIRDVSLGPDSCVLHWQPIC